MPEDATGALTGRRLMTKEFMNYKWSWDDGPYPGQPLANSFDQNDWVIGGGTQAWLSSETYIDLSGYNRDDLTTFPNQISIQESGSFRMVEDGTSAETGAIVLDIITEEKLPDGGSTKFQEVVTNVLNQEVVPGFHMGPLEFQQIIYGRMRMFGHDNTVWTATQGNLTLLNETQFGSGSPTTAAKLWCTRIVIPLGEYLLSGSFVIVPAARYILSATIGKEADLEYLMRLHRSYELGTA
jgi:hypothetical protein